MISFPSMREEFQKLAEEKPKDRRTFGEFAADTATILGGMGAGYLAGTGIHYGLHKAKLNPLKNMSPDRRRRILQGALGAAGLGTAAAHLYMRENKARVHEQRRTSAGTQSG